MVGAGADVGLGESETASGSNSAAEDVWGSTPFAGYAGSGTHFGQPSAHRASMASLSRSRGSSEGSASGGSPATHHYLYS